MQRGKPLNVVDLSETAANTCKYVSSKGRHCGIHIYIFYTKTWRFDGNSWYLYRSAFFVCFFKSTTYQPLAKMWVLLPQMGMEATTRGQGSHSSLLSLSLPFIFEFFKLLFFSWTTSPLPGDIIKRDCVTCFSWGDECRSRRRLFLFFNGRSKK